MIHIAICDDDEKDLEIIHTMLEDILVHSGIDCKQDLFTSASKMLDEVQNLDIAVLDISMKELNGIELGRKLKVRFPESRIIYTTSYEQYCMQAINEVHAFSFLCKPLEKRRLQEQITVLIQEIKSASVPHTKTFYKTSDTKGKEYDALKLDLKDIIFFEYIKSKRRIAIVLQNERYEYSYVMERLAEEIKPYNFVMNCRGVLVNLQHIIRIRGYEIYMDNGEVLPLSQKRAKQFKERMNEFIHNRV